ncbi:MAG: DUF4861 domain-containing protein [Mediterranea sp.]|nr:DUF4861 domain-containing protein [Mediterranea sp.]
MRKHFLALACLLVGGSALPASSALAQTKEKTIVVEVSNEGAQARVDAPVTLALGVLDLPFEARSAVVRHDGRDIPSQLDDLSGDRRADELAFVADFPAGSTKTFSVTFSSAKSAATYPSRVYADLFIADHRKGNHQRATSITVPGTSDIYSMVVPHGPMLESELVGYRLYFNEKQTPDIYGKFHKGLELEACRFYPSDEQLAKGFGDDVLRVFDSCGPGALKGWDGERATHVTPVDTRTERVVARGPVRAIAEIVDAGWQYQGRELNMTTRYTLYAGHRDLHVEVWFAERLADELFCTGVQDIKGSLSFSDHQGLVGCWGTDWPVNDTVKYAKETVGLGTYVPQRYVRREAKDKANYLYLIGAPNEWGFDYYTTFTSRKETFGYATPEAWFAYLRTWKEELEKPLKLRIRN